MRLSGLRGAARAVVAAELVRAHGNRPALVLVPNAKAADSFLDDLRAALGEAEEGRVRSFPRHDTQPYERFSPQPFVVAQRMDVLYRWLASAGRKRGGASPEAEPVVVAPWTALAMRVPSRDTVRERTVHLEIGQTLDRDALVEVLVAAGYERMPLVEERGELAVRGGILDLFPPQRALPLRIELLGDEVESIREFDPASQRSQEKLGYVVAPPPRELQLDRSLVVERSESLRQLAKQQDVAPRHVDELVDSLLRGHIPPGAEALAPLLQPAIESVLDFLPDDTLVIVDDPSAGQERLERYAREMVENFEVALAGGRVLSTPDDLALAPEALRRAIRQRNPVQLERLDVEDLGSRDEHLTLSTRGNETLRHDLVKARSSDAALTPLADQLEEWRRERWRVVLSVSSLSHAERLRTLLGEYGINAKTATDLRPVWRWSRAGRVEVRTAPLSEGFRLPIEKLAVVCEEEIFGPRERRRTASRRVEGTAIEGLTSLSPGDYLVHTEHGIGVYKGLVALELGAIDGEFLRLDYEGGDRLFVPVHRLNLIQRYAGSDGHTPRLDRLGGASWEKAKRSVRKSLRNMAHELLSMHAARALATGHSFSPRDRLLEEFEATFPYDETPDQLAVIEDVLADLQADRPMDRLVCGDVGFGKTEIALRAAFRVMMDGFQVAFLVPTTVLCQQHHETLRTRLERYPIEVRSLSRFQSATESKKVLEGIAAGTVDIVVGTHRLLQKNVMFRSLGLLIVDEEHRFGVAHKERIKQLRKNVDVVTLTATPIPRTLQLAFTGIRDLSVIDTPPANRMAIRTQVCRFSEQLVREAILREASRGGQTFFVHNRVRTIDAMADMLAKVVPEVKVIVAHGQMKERDLEERMMAFTKGEADVLLCTTIIESGLDIPRANTILINRADTLGLAQLYQLRGRVGRSDQRAYAYLMIPGPDAISPDAERRLEAIQDLTELGSGFRLANMDLEIRGAGNLLGAEQSGNLGSVGYETYMEMLQDTIDELRGQPRRIEIDPEIRLPVTARLPEDYVAVVNQRLVLYKRLASCRDDAEVDRIRDELLDRFGPLPADAENLLEVIRIKLLARALGIAAIDKSAGEIVLTASQTTSVDPQRLLNLLSQGGSGMRVAPGHKILAPAPTEGGAGALFHATRRLLTNLGEI
jgi:transcription-repair coupling factor (superfamily II helicase)